MKIRLFILLLWLSTSAHLLLAQKKNDCSLFTDAFNSSSKGFPDFIPGAELTFDVYDIPDSLLNVYEQLNFSSGWVAKGKEEISVVRPETLFTEWKMVLQGKKFDTNGKEWPEVSGDLEDQFRDFCFAKHTACLSSMKRSKFYYPRADDSNAAGEKMVCFLYSPEYDIPETAGLGEVHDLLKGSSYVRISLSKIWSTTMYGIDLAFYGAQYK